MLSGFREILDERRAARSGCRVVHVLRRHDRLRGRPCGGGGRRAGGAAGLRGDRRLSRRAAAAAGARGDRASSPRARLRPIRPRDLARADRRCAGERCGRRRARGRLEASVRGQRRLRGRRPRSRRQARRGDRGRAGSRRGRGGRRRRGGGRQADRSGGSRGVRRGDEGLVPGGVDRERPRQLCRRARARLGAARRDPCCGRRPALAPRRLGAARA